MKKILVLVVALLLVSPTVLAEKPDPNVPNPPLQVQEYNVDGDGYIAVHEQGIASVDIVDGVELDVNVTGGQVVVEDINEVGKQLVSWDCGNVLSAPSVLSACLQGSNYWEVPEGKRLVIETISLRLTVNPLGTLPRVDIITQLDGNEVTYWIPTDYVGVQAAGPFDLYFALQNVKIYTEHDDDTPVIVVRDTGSVTGFIAGAISGYLIDE